jgi:antitoxin ParD1/3/4
MTKTTSIVLGAPFQEFARRKVESGEFGSTSEVVREAMRRYIAEDLKLEALRAAIREGIESGPAEPFDFDDFIAEMKGSQKGLDAA